MNMQMVARSLLVYRISGSGIVLGLMALANAVPTIVCSLLGGALADRMQKKSILAYSMLGAMALSLVVGYAITTGYLGENVPGSW